jgi:hypothetical protein
MPRRRVLFLKDASEAPPLAAAPDPPRIVRMGEKNLRPLVLKSVREVRTPVLESR